MIKRYTFKFSAYVTKDVEFPDGCEEGSDEYEGILDRSMRDINVDYYADCEDTYEAEEGTPVSE